MNTTSAQAIIADKDAIEYAIAMLSLAFDTDPIAASASERPLRQGWRMTMKVLIACTPATGHLNPLLAVVRGLIDEWHEVTFLTGSAIIAMLQSKVKSSVERSAQ
ncbi:MULTISPECIES: hypothetical protein [Bradyrhizobium]|uniref:hypothetical protein n=1 Tax=Bradyrhizobium elkanii TaxID=29448 RepID=UPI000483AA42|nr:hypothetical protein [Bradyrhizobium elkanii]